MSTSCPRLYVAAGVVVFLSLFTATTANEEINIGCKFDTCSSSCIIKWDTSDREATNVYINQTATASCTQKFIEYNDSFLYDPNDGDLYRSSYTEFGECLFEIKTLASDPTKVNITSTTDGIKAFSACGKPSQGCVDQSNTFFILRGVNMGSILETSSSSCIIKWDTRDMEATNVYINQTATASCTQKFIEHNDSFLYDPNDGDLYRSSYTVFGECLFEIKTLASDPTEVNITSTTDGVNMGSKFKTNTSSYIIKSDSRDSNVQNSKNGARGEGTSTGVLMFAGMMFCVLSRYY